MKVSIAMATYNGEKYIREQLDSFARQTRLPDELIISDDCSTDETVKICEEFAREVPFDVRIFQNSENLKYAKNFERAISLTSGDIIFLSDQDDVWFESKIEFMTQSMIDNPEALVGINDTEIVDEQLHSTGLRKSRQVLNLGLSINSFITGCCTVIKAGIKELFIPVPVEHFAHDNWLHRLAILMDSRVFINKTLQYYRRYENNTSDWIGSSTKKVNNFDLFLLYKGKDPLENCRRRLNALEYTKNHIKKKKDKHLITTDIEKKIEAAFLKINQEKAALIQRCRILEMPRIMRLRVAIKMLYSGNYNYFSGFKSFAKDLMWKC